VAESRPQFERPTRVGGEGDLRIEPFEGTVAVTFSDAIIASTDRARILREPGHMPVRQVGAARLPGKASEGG